MQSKQTNFKWDGRKIYYAAKIVLNGKGILEARHI